MGGNVPDLDGGSGGIGPPDGGGVPGTGTGSSSVTSGLPAGENGGVFGSTYFLFVPSQSIYSGLSYIGYFDTTSFDDSVDDASYSYRMEDIKLNHVPTVDVVVLTYRDLGAAVITVALSGTNDDGQVVSSSAKVQIGNKVPTNALLTKFVGLRFSAFRPQLTISRSANSGPVSIVSATLKGTVSEVEY